MSAPRVIPQATLLAQHKASHPAASAWVSANAGSGKTHVLAQRVVRLLLAGTPPGRILCLTFTKTAAANMADRVFQTLARWTLLGDAELADAIQRTGAEPPGAQELVFARRLFARTLETPGGLKIQTIHAFCERLLHTFPFEANVAAGFEVIEPQQQGELMAQAQDAALEAAMQDTGDLGAALQMLAGDTSEGTFGRVLAETLKYRHDLAERALEVPGAALAYRLGLKPGDTQASVMADMLHGGLTPERWSGLADWLDGGKVTDQKNAQKLRSAKAALDSGDADGALEKYLDFFFTQKLEPRKKLVTQELVKTSPKAAAALAQETLRLEASLDKRKAAAVVERTAALLTLATAIFGHYEQLKAQRSLIDFDDLIQRTKSLLSRSEAAWVLYKLDSGIDHILVDEAQDTSPTQWDILRALASDFTAGTGQRSQRRTLFAVGDEKQSIYSFQGAAPHMFAAMRGEFRSRIAAAGQSFESVSLNLSFRSAPEILAAVDNLFQIPANFAGLSADIDQQATVHGALKTDLRGLVEIWPLVAASPLDQPPDWEMPLDAVDASAPASQLALRIARTIRQMVAPGSEERVIDSGTGLARAIGAGDILILVRSRNAFFDAIIRALKDEKVDVAGADRLELTTHIAVMDLMAAGRVALLPEDDLTLAAVLKSPLVGLDDNDLITLAPQREGSLIAALQSRSEARFLTACARVGQWRLRAQERTPFEFYAALLGADGGRRALLERLGQEAGDAIDEFLSLALAHQRSQAPSLAKFLGGLEAASLEIKRDMEAPGQAVRVMTVHAAKGLEAKIVFLPDTCARPGAPRDPAVFRLEPGKSGPDGKLDAGVLAWSPKMAADPVAVATERENMRRLAVEENRRLLYVAMTRAEERLYLSGFCGVNGPAPGCWYTMLANALTPQMRSVPAPWDAAAHIWQSGAPLTSRVHASQKPPVAKFELPGWLDRPAPKEAGALPPLRPSQALEAADRAQADDPQASLARAVAQASGRHLHVLLQYLPGLDTGRRKAAGVAYLAAEAGMMEPLARAALLEIALKIAADQRLECLFGTNCLAEVSVTGHLLRVDGSRLGISGQIDRLAIQQDEVLIADFKTGQPREIQETPANIVTQMAVYRELVRKIYPAKQVRAMVVWTHGPAIVELEGAQMDAAVQVLRRV